MHNPGTHALVLCEFDPTQRHDHDRLAARDRLVFVAASAEEVGDESVKSLKIIN